MRLPCERYIRLCALRGQPVQQIFKALTQLGYPPPDQIPELEVGVRQIVRECSGVPQTTAGPSEQVLTHWQLQAAWSSPMLLRDVEYAIRYPKLRKFIEMTFIAGAKPAEVQSMLLTRQGITVSEAVLALYQHLVMDMTILAEYEADLFFEVHLYGDTYRTVHALGVDGALFYAGEQVVFNPDEAFEFVCQGSYLKCRELLLYGDAKGTAAAVRSYVGSMETAHKMMGPTVAFRKLQMRMEKFKIATMPVPSTRMGPGIDIAGKLGARVELAEIQDMVDQVLHQFQEVLQPQQLPPGGA